MPDTPDLAALRQTFQADIDAALRGDAEPRTHGLAETGLRLCDELERLRAQLAECHAHLQFIAHCPMEQRCDECTRRAAALLRRHGREA